MFSVSDPRQLTSHSHRKVRDFRNRHQVVARELIAGLGSWSAVRLNFGGVELSAMISAPIVVNKAESLLWSTNRAMLNPC